MQVLAFSSALDIICHSQVIDIYTVGPLSTVIMFSPHLRGWFFSGFRETSAVDHSSIPVSPETTIITTGLSTGDHPPVEW